jgi:cyclopropane-fatty-acyl-phospholipid synthase
VLTIHEGGATFAFGRPDPEEPNVELWVDDPAFYADTVFGGSVGLAEAYMKGFWHTSDLTGLLWLGQRNQGLVEGLDGGWSWPAKVARGMLLHLHRNTPQGSRRNIHAHYDLGNEFFQLFLDPTMMYSCALFDRPGMTLEEASTAKNDRICRKLHLGQDDHLLEIGTGWGGFAVHAATHYGCRVTTTTISDAQFELAGQRIAAAGLSDRITLLKQDYRTLDGTFDKLVSIEMIEAVGHRFYADYFAACSRLLADDGRMLLQAITIDDRQYDRARREVDFIQRYIFPGGCLPSVATICECLKKHTDFRLVHHEDLTEFYPPTLRAWHDALMAQRETVRKMGFPDSFLRMWEFYFRYCEVGFLERWIGTVQMVFAKPGCRAPAIFGDL